MGTSARKESMITKRSMNMNMNMKIILEVSITLQKCLQGRGVDLLRRLFALPQRAALALQIDNQKAGAAMAPQLDNRKAEQATTLLPRSLKLLNLTAIITMKMKRQPRRLLLKPQFLNQKQITSRTSSKKLRRE